MRHPGIASPPSSCCESTAGETGGHTSIARASLQHSVRVVGGVSRPMLRTQESGPRPGLSCVSSDEIGSREIAPLGPATLAFQ